MISYEIITRAEDLGRVAESIEAGPAVGLDIECTALRPWRGDIRLVQVGTARGNYVIDVFQTQVLGPVIPALANERVVKIIHSAKFEQQWFLFHYGLELWPVFDTHRASAIIYNGKPLGHNLYDVWQRELGVVPESLDQGGSNWKGVLSSSQLAYAAEDIVHLIPLREKLKQKLAEHGLNRIALIEFGAVLPEAAVEINGFRLDAGMWRVLAEKNRAKAQQLDAELLAELPHPMGQMGLFGAPVWKLSSTQQLQKSLARLGCKVDSTAEETIGMLVAKFPVLKKVLEHRQVAKRVSTYGEDYLKHIDSYDGRIHVDYWPLLKTGRYAPSNPNLGQIPRDKDFRSCFREDEDHCMVLADYGQVELRAAAEYSQDPALLECFHKNEDVHAKTGAAIAGVPISQLTKEQRQASKPVNFGLAFSMGPPKLVIYAQLEYGVTLSLDQAKDYYAKYFDLYKGVKRFHRYQEKLMRTTDVCRNLWGRLRYMGPSDYGEWFNCLDAETEALTMRGWVRGLDLLPEDTILTKNPSSGALEWQQPTDLRFFPDYEGELYEFTTPTLSAVTTPGHRWLVRDDALGEDVELTSETLVLDGTQGIHLAGHYRAPGKSLSQADLLKLATWFTDQGHVPGPPPVLWDLHRDQLRALFSTVLGGVRVFGGTAAQVDAFQALCVLVGFASVQKGLPGPSDTPDVVVHDLSEAFVEASDCRRFEARTPVWCPILPNTFFVARRLGKVFVTGNTPIQSSCADALKRALRNVYFRLKKYGKDVKMVHHVHDEIITRARRDPELCQAVKKEIEEGMVESAQDIFPSVPIRADGSIAESWAEK